MTHDFFSKTQWSYIYIYTIYINIYNYIDRERERERVLKPTKTTSQKHQPFTHKLKNTLKRRVFRGAMPGIRPTCVSRERLGDHTSPASHGGRLTESHSCKRPALAAVERPRWLTSSDGRDDRSTSPFSGHSGDPENLLSHFGP